MIILDINRSINIKHKYLIIISHKQSDIKKFKKDFDEIFKTKNLKEIKKILNIKVTRNRHQRTLYLN